MRAIIETQFLAPISVFSTLKKCDEVLIDVHESYQKRSYRNKCFLTGPQGKISFSIPLKKGKHEQQLITQVEIAYDENWIRQFKQLCQSNYSRSAFLEHIFDDICTILDLKHQYLYELNTSLHLWINQFLELEYSLSETDDYHSTYNAEDLTDYRHHWLPKHQLNNKFYPQVFEDKNGFVAGLSILDLLFCCGKEAELYL